MPNNLETNTLWRGLTTGLACASLALAACGNVTSEECGSDVLYASNAAGSAAPVVRANPDCEPQQAQALEQALCGNGVLDADEACDDGNLEAGDGCSAACELDDDVATPGDDRRGFVSCENRTTGEELTCGEWLGCCPMPTPSCGTFDSCTAANDGNPMAAWNPCDGPEDCAQGERCWQEKGGTMCSVTGGYNVKCHVDADCPESRPYCLDDGSCGTGAE